MALSTRTVIKGLKFDGPENGCQSLRILAELVRRGEITMTAFPPNPGGDNAVLRLSFPMPAERKGAAND